MPPTRSPRARHGLISLDGLVSLEASAGDVVGGFEYRNDRPVTSGEAHDDEESPDGDHRPDVLRRLEPRKRKPPAPWHRTSQSVSVEDALLPETTKDRHVQPLSDCQ